MILFEIIADAGRKFGKKEISDTVVLLEPNSFAKFKFFLT